jgi:hypothetical protein
MHLQLTQDVNYLNHRLLSQNLMQRSNIKYKNPPKDLKMNEQERKLFDRHFRFLGPKYCSLSKGRNFFKFEKAFLQILTTICGIFSQ